MSSPTTRPYRNHRFPSEIISHAVWLYHRFRLSFREVEEMLAKRGMTVNSETVRQWCFKFVQTDQNCGRVMQEFRDVIALIKVLTERKHLPNRRALRKGSGILGTTTYAVF